MEWVHLGGVGWDRMEWGLGGIVWSGGGVKKYRSAVKV